MKKNFVNILLLALIFGVSSIYAAQFLKPESVKQDVSQRQVLNILFVGNSYIFFNDMPDVIKELAAHDPDAPFRIETKTLAAGGATLASLLTRPDTNKILTSKQWHYVVLQPQSLWATTKARTASTNLALMQWNNKINKIGALPVFFMTWPRKPGTNWYQLPKFKFIKSPDFMFSRIQQDSKKYADKL